MTTKRYEDNMHDEEEDVDALMMDAEAVTASLEEIMDQWTSPHLRNTTATSFRLRARLRDDDYGDEKDEYDEEDSNPEEFLLENIPNDEDEEEDRMMISGSPMKTPRIMTSSTTTTLHRANTPVMSNSTSSKKRRSNNKNAAVLSPHRLLQLPPKEPLLRMCNRLPIPVVFGRRNNRNNHNKPTRPLLLLVVVISFVIRPVVPLCIPDTMMHCVNMYKPNGILYNKSNGFDNNQHRVIIRLDHHPGNDVCENNKPWNSNS
jgi:hypothetical protein